MTFRSAIGSDLPQIASLYRAAIKTYQRLGFAFLAQADLYGNRFYLCEKKL